VAESNAGAQIPRHIGIIQDGNRRWAKQHGKSTVEGHRAGYEALNRIVELAFDKGVKELSVYAFSTENWRRSKQEVQGTMNLIRWIADNRFKDLHKKNVKLRISGFREKVEADILKRIDKAVENTKNNTRGVLNICFNYGGRADITESVRRLIKKGIKAEDISEEAISAELSTAGMHDVDLIIRTSEYRLSNFLPWESIYAEIYFVPDIYWPDFNEIQFNKALDFYANRKRRFGG
jgi:undecaprenyl diphosphate synthase